MLTPEVRQQVTGVRLASWERAALEAMARNERVTLTEVIRRALQREAKHALMRPEVRDEGE